MKHVILRFIVMGIGITAAVPAASAEGNNGGSVCYADGVARSCVQPPPVYLNPAPSSGMISGALTPGTGSRRLTPPVQMMILSACSRNPRSVSTVRIDEASGAGSLINGHSQALEMLPQR